MRLLPGTLAIGFANAGATVSRGEVPTVAVPFGGGTLTTVSLAAMDAVLKNASAAAMRRTDFMRDPPMDEMEWVLEDAPHCSRTARLYRRANARTVRGL